MKKTIAVLAGDGIGPEIMAQAIRVLEAVEKRYGHEFEKRPALVGGAAWDVYGEHCPPQTLDVCRSADAILFGATGGPVSDAQLPKWKGCEANSILALRKTFRFHANFRPVRIFSTLAGASPLRPEITAGGVDFIIVRELLGDVYFGEKRLYVENGLRTATDVARYDEEQIAKIAKVAFEAARKRRKKVTSVDKANVLETSRLWRKVVHEVGASYSDVALEDLLVDNCAMQLVTNPSRFDIVVTSNMFGDILSDEGAVLAGSLGVLPSSSFNDEGFALYEPPSGSAPDIAGQGVANPIGQILCVAMMLRFSFGLKAEAEAVEAAVGKTLGAGYRTADIMQGGGKLTGTAEMTDRILEHL